MFEVESVEKGGAAQRSGIQKGDRIFSFNGEKFIDYIDYIYFSAKKKLKVRLERGGEIKTIVVKKTEDENLGIIFTEPLLGKKRVCGNKCVFCFVDQLPRRMRKSLYLKDEDWRYSLIMGNYVTLSSISAEEVARILRRKASPLYISVHTVDEELRRCMLGNPDSVPIKLLLKKFASHGIRFHAQIVVCPGMNDGGKLEETYRFLKKLHPAAMSLAVVPVGLTAFRKGLAPVNPVQKEDAADIIKRVEKWQRECLNDINTRFVFAADELYIKAQAPLPPAADYEQYQQIENGVGMLAKFLHEAGGALDDMKHKPRGRVSIATGEDAYPYFVSLAEQAGADARMVYKVPNLTFGGGVTVSGLLAGRDFLEALSGKDLGDMLLISSDALRDDVFLDDMTLAALEEALNVKIYPVSDGQRFAELLCGVPAADFAGYGKR